jgi:hypothetical protein
VVDVLFFVISSYCAVQYSSFHSGEVVINKGPPLPSNYCPTRAGIHYWQPLDQGQLSAVRARCNGSLSFPP